QFALSYALVIAGAALTGNPIRRQLMGFPLVFALTVVALLLAGNRFLNDLGLEAVIFGLLIGLAVGNLFRLPEWFRQWLNAEMLALLRRLSDWPWATGCGCPSSLSMR